MGVWMAHTDSHGAKTLHQNQIYRENGSGLILRDFVHDFYPGKAPADFAPLKQATCATGTPVTPSRTASIAAAAVPYQFPDGIAATPSASPLKPCPGPVPRPIPSPGAARAAPTPSPGG